MLFDFQVVNPKTGKAVRVQFDTDNRPVLEDIIYEQMIEMLSCDNRLTQAQREKIARDTAKEAAQLKRQGKPPFENTSIPTRAELKKGKRPKTA